MAVAEHKKKNSLSNKTESESGRETHWAEVQEKAVRRSQRRNLRHLWAELEDPSAPLRWGVATAMGSTSPTTDQLSRIAANLSAQQAVKSQNSAADLPEELAASGRHLLERLRDGAGKVPLGGLLEGLVWAYAMPELAIHHSAVITEELWWDLLGELQILHTTGLEQALLDSPERLLASEIGAVLSWRLVDLHSCAALQEGALRGIHEWFDESGHAVAAAVGEGGRWSRVVLASALRARRLASKMKERLPLKKSGAAVDLATWVAALTRTDASMVLQSRGAHGRDDLGPSGLFAAAIREVGGPSLQMASDASLGRLKSDGKLAWRVELPEPGWFEEDAGLAVMLPEWDVRRGRVAIHYHGNKCHVEVSGGKTPLILGDWRVQLKVSGKPLEPTSNWSDVCWYSDDDVHYLEIEQSFTGGLRVQRQWMMLRDDQCLLMADAVVGGKPGDLVEYRSTIPLVSSAHVEEERETRELFLVEGKVRAMVLPLALNEWRVGPAQGRLSVADETDSADSNTADNLMLVTEMRGDGAIYAPLWLDFDRKRLTKERTWRQLTVGQGLRLVPINEGAAFRVQAGDDQWLVYRSLSGPANRTFMGKNLISEFFCGRFDGESGDVEELISVDEQTE